MLADPKMKELLPYLGYLSEQNWNDIYDRFVHFWAFHGEFTIDYFIEKFEAIPESQWCIKTTEDEFGRKDASGHCGVKRSGPLTREALVLNKFVYTDYLCISYVNDGTLAAATGSTPKARVVNVLKKLKIKWLNLQEISKTFSEEPTGHSSN